MTDLRGNLFVFAAIVLLCVPTMRGAEPNAIVTNLRFEDGHTVLSWPNFPIPPAYRLHNIDEKNLRPTHAAGITLRWPGNVEAPGDGFGERFLEYALRTNAILLSTRQRAFLSALARPYPRSCVAIQRAERWTAEGSSNEPNCYGVLLYATSPEDAREMARAYVRYARSEFERKLEEATSRVRRTEEAIVSYEKRIGELEELLKTSLVSLEEHKKIVPYRSDEEAAAAIGELDRMINAARVDIAGIQEKLAAIQAYPQDKRTQAVFVKLEVMFVEEALALREAEARKREATNLRSQAARLIDLNKTVREADGEKASSMIELRRLPQQLQAENAWLTQVKEQEPQVLDNTVFIYAISD